jgi:hypothetical protein
MTPPQRSKSRLLVVVDPQYGHRLLEMEPRRPVWITMSPANKPAVYSLWQTCPEPDHLTGITGFQFDPDIGPAERFLAQLRTIDVHHGAYSSSNPYTELEVIGAPLTVAIREALSQLGFSKFIEGQDCFVASRSGGDLPRKRLNADEKRALKAASVRSFVQQYERKAQRGAEPNDRRGRATYMNHENPKQWRIENANHLRGVRLKLRRYNRRSENWDHDHCSACWAKFAEFNGPEIQHEGYATWHDYGLGAGYEWVCRKCFDDLKDDLGWTASSE